MLCVCSSGQPPQGVSRRLPCSLEARDKDGSVSWEYLTTKKFPPGSRQLPHMATSWLLPTLSNDRLRKPWPRLRMLCQAQVWGAGEPGAPRAGDHPGLTVCGSETRRLHQQPAAASTPSSVPGAGSPDLGCAAPPCLAGLSPLCDMPSARHFWKRQYWHLFRFFFWILQLRSHFSYSSFMRIVRRKKPCGTRDVRGPCCRGGRAGPKKRLRSGGDGELNGLIFIPVHGCPACVCLCATCAVPVEAGKGVGGQSS